MIQPLLTAMATDCPSYLHTGKAKTWWGSFQQILEYSPGIPGPVRQLKRQGKERKEEKTA